MDIVTPEQHRALKFVGLCNSEGYAPTVDELGLWLSASPRRPVSAFQRQLAQVAINIGTQFSNALGAGPTTGEYESLAAFLVRLRWMTSESSLRLTPLGTALLSATERQGQTREDEVQTVVLDREDPLAYPRLVGHLAKIDDGLLVDPHLGLNELHEVVAHTSIQRVLISKQRRGSRETRAALAVYLGSAGLTRHIEVRASSDQDLHDRFIVNVASVEMLGHSLNGISGRHASTTVIPLPPDAAKAQRAKIERWWTEAEVVAAPAPPAGQPADDAVSN